MSKKTILITGSSSGIGKLTAKLFQKKGWNVIATMRSPEKEDELTKLDNVLVTRLDVQDQASINTAVQEGINKFGKIDVLVNNAGYLGQGLLEQFSEEAILRMFDTNLFGQIRVMKAALPDMRKRREGCIINMTSGCGYFAVPLSCIYSSTRFAVRGLSESLYYDYKSFNIQIKTVAPGAYQTGFAARLDNHLDSGDEELQYYSKDLHTHMFESSMKDMGHGEGVLGNPQEVADKIFECATEETPVHNIVGKDVEGLVAMRNSMPSHQDFLDKMSELFLPKADVGK